MDKEMKNGRGCSKGLPYRLIWVALAAFVIFGCDKDEDSGKIYNAMFNVVDNLRTPTMIANAEGLTTWVLPGDKLKFKAVPAPDSSGVTYEWTFSAGNPVASSIKNVTWQAPAAQGTVTVRLKCKKASEYFYDEGFTVHVVNLNLAEVSFSGDAANEYCEVQSDPPGSIGYSAPHWTPGASKPVCYVRKKKMRLESKVNVAPAAALTGATIKMKGDGPGNLDIATDDPASEAAGVVTSKIKPTDGELPDSVKFYDKLAIQWGISLDDGKRWFTPPALKSENRVYVTLATPTPTLYETLLYVSCKAADGDSTPNSAFKDIWGKVKSLKVKKENGDSLWYYQFGNAGMPIPTPWGLGWEAYDTTAELIEHKNGDCSSWQAFFHDLNGVHGIAVESRWFHGDDIAFGVRGIIVKNVLLKKESWPGTDFPYNPVQYDAVNPVAGGDIDYEVDKLKGQGPNMRPAKIFNYHAVNMRTDIYDASYGKTYNAASAAKNFENAAIAAFLRPAGDRSQKNTTAKDKCGIYAAP